MLLGNVAGSALELKEIDSITWEICCRIEAKYDRCHVCSATLATDSSEQHVSFPSHPVGLCRLGKE